MMTFGTMDLCHFMKVLVGGLALRILVISKPTREGIHSSIFPFFCDIKFKKINLVDDITYEKKNIANKFYVKLSF